MGDRLRIGAVRYLNAKPLYHGLEALAPGVDVLMDVPSALATRLGRGELDLALIPSVEYLRGAAKGYTILPGFAIAARGPVRSVKLLSRVPFRDIRRLALDEGSRTSQALCRVWLDAAHGVRPERVEPLPLGVPVAESTADAILIIGDRAMTDPPGEFAASVDLGEAWNALTGLPFVFALWVARPGADLGDLPTTLERVKAENLARADDLARRYGPPLGLDAGECFDYLTKNLSYDLGAPEMAGLRRFGAMAAALGLAPGGADLAFYRRLDLAPGR